MGKGVSTVSAVIVLVVVVVAGVAGYYVGTTTSATGAHAASTITSTITSTTTVSGAAAPGKVLTQAVNVIDVATLDPTMCNGDCSWIYPNVYESLVTFDPKLNNYEQVVPGLARSYTVSSDGTVYTFDIRHGIMTHMGNELTANDFVFALTRLFASNFSAPYAPGKQIYAGTVSAYTNASLVKALDKYTLQVTLVHPNAAFLLLLAQGLFGGDGFLGIDSALMTHQVKTSNSSDWGSQWLGGGHDAGTGAYYIASYVPDTGVVLKRFDGYWRGVAPISEIDFKIVKDSTVQRLMLQRGDIQIAHNLGTDDIRTLQTAANASQSGINIIFGDSNSAFGLNYCANCTGAPPALKDYRVRLALSELVDYNTIISTLLNGQGAPMYGVFNKPRLGWDAWGGKTPIQYNVTDAKRLLAEAGYGSGLTLTLLHYQDADVAMPITDIALLLQSDFAKAGVTLNLQQGPVAVIEQQRNAKTYQLFFAYNGWSNMDSDGSVNFANFRYTRVSGCTVATAEGRVLQAQGAAAVDPNTRAQIYRQYDTQVWYTTLCSYWFIDPYTGIAVSDRLIGWYFVPGAAGGFSANVFDMNLAP